MRYLLLIACIFLPALVHAQDATGYDVEHVRVNHLGEDELGMRVAGAVRQAVEESEAFDLVTRSFPYSHLHVSLRSIDAVKGSPVEGSQSIVSATLSVMVWNADRDPSHSVALGITTAIFVCGRNRVGYCTSNVMDVLYEDGRAAGSVIKNMLVVSAGYFREHGLMKE